MSHSFIIVVTVDVLCMKIIFRTSKRTNTGEENIELQLPLERPLDFVYARRLCCTNYTYSVNFIKDDP